jgi:UDP-N-acetylmuramoyl-tripeptide--D-alanyl-D-alanine ligase
MRNFVKNRLAHYAHKLINKEQPFVIAVTGSVGKSSTKDAVAAVLSKSFQVRSSPGNYNTEFGLPLAILGLELPTGKLGWLSTLWQAWRRVARSKSGDAVTYVLEMGADKPGDLDELCDIASPHISVVTAVGESHLEFFGSVENIAKEKRTLVERLNKEGVAILNRDDARVWEMRSRAKGKVVSYGFHEEADIRAEEQVGYACSFDHECGMHFKVRAQGATVPMFVSSALGRQSIYAALAAVAVGIERGMNLVDIGDALRSFRPQPGRMRYVPGIKRSVLIDDTYNSAPRSALAALYVLREIPADAGARKWAVLGDMLELGSGSEAGHMQIGREAAENADVMVFVGERMADAVRAAREAGAGDDRVFHFAGTEEAGLFVQGRMKSGDVILVKGSQGMRMERVVKELMADPLAAERTLVRQSAKWLATT